MSQKYHEKSIVHCITTQVPMLPPSLTLQEVKKYLTQHSFHSIDYLYVVSSTKKILGVLSIKELFRNASSIKLGDLCKRKELITVLPTTTQERAAHIALRHNLKSIPVVDERHIFLGAVTNEKLLTIIHQEAREDTLRLAGIHRAHVVHEDILTLPLLQAVKHRIPWLILGLFGGMLAAIIISSFEKTLQSHLILVAFLPLIVYMADAVGTQVETFVIRDFALATQLDYKKYALRQCLIVFIIAFILGIGFALISYVFYADILLSLVISLALFFAIISSMSSGLLIPFIFTKLNMDPANASGPIATIIQDILSVTIYFFIAFLLL